MNWPPTAQWETIWPPNLASQFGLPIWPPNLASQIGLPNWPPKLASQFGLPIWPPTAQWETIWVDKEQIKLVSVRNPL